MIDGEFPRNVPLVTISVGWNGVVQSPKMVLDTGFSGDLQITPQMAKELDLKMVDVVSVQIADGQVVELPVVQAVASVEGVKKFVHALISNGSPLVGINFFSRFAYKIIVDCKNKTIALKKVD